MSGLPEVDMDDWEKNTTYANGYGTLLDMFTEFE